MSIEGVTELQVSSSAAALQGVQGRSTDTAGDWAVIGSGRTPGGETLDLPGKLVPGEAGGAQVRLDYPASLDETLDNKGSVTVDLASGKSVPADGEATAQNYTLTLSKNEDGRIEAEVSAPDGRTFQVDARFTEGGDRDLQIDLSQRVTDALRATVSYDQATDTVGVGAAYDRGDVSASAEYTPGLDAAEMSVEVADERQTTSLQASTADGGETVDAELKSVTQVGDSTVVTLAGQSLAGQLKASGEVSTKVDGLDVTIRADTSGSLSAEAAGPLGEDVDVEAAWNSDGDVTVAITAQLNPRTEVMGGIADGQPTLSVSHEFSDSGEVTARYGSDGSGGEEFRVGVNATF